MLSRVRKGIAIFGVERSRNVESEFGKKKRTYSTAASTLATAEICPAWQHADVTSSGQPHNMIFRAERYLIRIMRPAFMRLRMSFTGSPSFRGGRGTNCSPESTTTPLFLEGSTQTVGRGGYHGLVDRQRAGNEHRGEDSGAPTGSSGSGMTALEIGGFTVCFRGRSCG